jgi:hypothetical protein
LPVPTINPLTSRAAHAAAPRPFRPAAAALAAAAALIAAAPASGQETREAQLARLQAEKAARLRPHEPEGLEKRFDTIDGLLFAPERRLYAFVGSAFDGGGLAVGPGVRSRFGGTGAVTMHAAWSLKNYRVADATVRLPGFVNDRVTVALKAHWLDAPDVAFYGVGQHADAARTGLAYRAATVGVSARVQPARLVSLGGGVDSIAMETGPATTGDAAPAPSIDPAYARTHLFAEFDSRTAERYTRDGSLVRVQWSDYRQLNGSSHSFGRVDAEVQHFVPLLRENWVIAMRALASSTTTGDGSEVPYVLLPDLGGSRTLRGYSSWRFRDRHRLLLTGEYRWTAGPLVDMALFMDAGKVAARSGDLDLAHLTATYGIGASFHTEKTTIMRIELARTREGNSLVLSFGPSF